MSTGGSQIKFSIRSTHSLSVSAFLHKHLFSNSKKSIGDHEATFFQGSELKYFS
jgi:hypothetical protein